MSYSVLMPVFAKEILHGGSHTYGFLMGAAGFGALLGALFLASRETVLKLGRIVPAATYPFWSRTYCFIIFQNFSLFTYTDGFYWSGNDAANSSKQYDFADNH